MTEQRSSSRGGGVVDGQHYYGGSFHTAGSDLQTIRGMNDAMKKEALGLDLGSQAGGSVWSTSRMEKEPLSPCFKTFTEREFQDPREGVSPIDTPSMTDDESKAEEALLFECTADAVRVSSGVPPRQTMLGKEKRQRLWNFPDGDEDFALEATEINRTETKGDVDTLARGARALHKLMYVPRNYESSHLAAMSSRRVGYSASPSSTASSSFLSQYIWNANDRQQLQANLDALPIVLHAMKMHPNDSCVQKLGCFLLASSYARDKSGVEMLASHGGLGLVARALEQHRHDPDIMHCAKQVVNALNEHLQNES